MMFSISWQMSLVALLVLPLAGGVITLIAKSSQKQFLRQQTQLGELNGHIEEMYGGHQVMRVFNGQKKSIAKFSKINNRLQESAWKAQFFSGLIHPIINFISNIGYVAMTILGGWLAINGRLKSAIFRRLFSTSISSISRWFRLLISLIFCNRQLPPPSECLSFWTSQKKRLNRITW